MGKLIDADHFMKRFESMCEKPMDSLIAMIVRGVLKDEPEVSTSSNQQDEGNNISKVSMQLPCEIGADVYSVPSEVNFKLNRLHGYTEGNHIYHQVVKRITFIKNGWFMEGDVNLDYGNGRLLRDKNYKVTWFLSEEEAKAKLKEMENEYGE